MTTTIIGADDRAFALAPSAVATSNESPAANTYVPVDTTSGAVTITLLAAPVDRTVIGVQLVNGANPVTVTCSGSDVLNIAGGPTSLTLKLSNESVLLQYAASPAIWYRVANDLPLSDLDARYFQASGTTLPVSSGGTGQTAQQAAMDALAGATTSGDFLRGNGTHVVMGPIQAGDVPTLNQSTTGNAATAGSFTGSLAGDVTGTQGATAVSKIGGIAVPSAAPSTSQLLVATSTSASKWVSRDFNVMAYGATGNGTSDDTTAIQAALNAAGTAGGTVYFPAAPGGCYRTSGLTVPTGVVRLRGECELFRSNAPTSAYLTGAVLAPINSSVTCLLTIGSSGSGTVVTTNPHGLVVEGIGFLGTVAAGSCVIGLWGAIVTDTSDAAFNFCRDMYMDTPYGSPWPGGGSGSGAGGWLKVLSSGSGNGFSENCRVTFHGSVGCGNWMLVDGSVTSAGGSTDGRVVSCQLNSFNNGIQFGPSNAGTGGWGVMECHFSSQSCNYNISYGATGSPYTLRVVGCYFDVAGGPHITCGQGGRGLEVTGSYFRGSSNNTMSLQFNASLNHTGRDPAALIVGNTLDLNQSTTYKAFGQFLGFTAANMASSGGGVYRGNLIHNHGHAMPGSWVSPYIGSDSLAVATTSSATLDLYSGPVLSG